MGKADSRRGLIGGDSVTMGPEVEGSKKGSSRGRVVFTDPASTEGIATLIKSMLILVA